jgi:hypothetical protein
LSCHCRHVYYYAVTLFCGLVFLNHERVPPGTERGKTATAAFGDASKAAQGRDHLLDELMAAAAR